MRIGFFLLWLTLGFPQSVHAADFTLVVGFAAGGTSSTAARAILEPFARASGKRLLIENKPGAGGLLAAQYVASQGPESGMLLFMSSNSSLRVPTDIGLVPVAVVAHYDYVLAQRQPGTSLTSYLARAKIDPALLSVATAGAGSIAHLSVARLFREHDATMLHVPYQGSAPAINAVLGGHVALAMVPYPDFLPFEGSLSVLARTGNGLVDQGWMGVYAPPGTSGAEVSRLAAWLRVACVESAQTLAKFGFVAAFEPSSALEHSHQADRDRFLPELELQGVRF